MVVSVPFLAKAVLQEAKVLISTQSVQTMLILEEEQEEEVVVVLLMDFQVVGLED